MSSTSTTILLQEALALYRRGSTAEATARYAEVLRTDPTNADAHYYLGMLSCQGGRFAEGAKLASQALSCDPRHARAHILLGRALSALGRGDEALASFERAVALAPELAEAHSHRAEAFADLGRHAAALDSYDRALLLAPDGMEDWCNRALVLDELGRREEAISSFDRAIASQPDFAQAHLWRAEVLLKLGRTNEALAGVDKALAINPELAEAWLGRGHVLTRLGHCQDAMAAYDKALSIKSDFAEAWLGRGNAFRKLKRHDDALVAYDRALALKPDLAGAWVGRGNVLFECERYEDALLPYETALQLDSDLAEAWLGRSNVLFLLRRYSDAVTACDRALAAQPELDYAPALRLFAKLNICDWADLESEATQLIVAMRSSPRVNDPFMLLPLPAKSADQLDYAKRYVEAQAKFTSKWQGQIYRHDRIRVAYLSADFREHAVAHLIAGLLEQHDRSRFEITGISFGPNRNSKMRQRLSAAVERFVDVADRSDEQIAELVRHLEIDIAVDLMGFTLHNRLNVLARRAAPIQINYLGYAGTMGASYIDYIVADTTAIPAEHFASYSEKVLWLPGSFMASDDKRRIAETTPARNEHGLPEDGFVFCCFNQFYKMDPTILNVWMRLLRAVEGSVLWLRDGNNDTATHNLRREAERRGISSDRLIFAPSAPDMADHLARLRLADLFLDTLHYNAHATASDALWVGVPLVTCLGSTFASRVGASLLKAIGLDELITKCPDDYEALALKLANKPSYLHSIKQRLADNRVTHPLFDTARFTRYLEAAYEIMWQRQQRGEPAQAFAVTSAAEFAAINVA